MITRMRATLSPGPVGSQPALWSSAAAQTGGKPALPEMMDSHEQY
jgi:hypothetical protein